MTAVAVQLSALTDELTVLRNEMIQVKSAHAALHQGAVETNAGNVKMFEEQIARMSQIEGRMGSIAQNAQSGPGGEAMKKRPLIEAKQVTVEVFTGSVADNRSKFLAWAERVKDRITLYEPGLIEAMKNVEHKTSPISADESRAIGITDAASREMHGFLKGRTEGTAHSIIRSNRSEVGLESWRLLATQFNPKTIQSTMSAEHLERNPKGASKMSEMPARLLEWERNLRRCLDEG